MSALDPADADRLIKLLGMLGSSFGGERAAAGLKAHEFLRQRGLTWSDIVKPALPPPQPKAATSPEPETWQAKVQKCLRHKDALTEWEVGFLNSIRYRSRLTPKQSTVLDRIATKIREMAQ